MPKRLKILRGVSDHDSSWLTDRLAETVPEGEFWFYFRDLSDNPLRDCNAILSRLGMAPVAAENLVRRDDVL